MIEIGDMIICRTYNKYGDVIRRTKRTVIGMFKNIKGETVIEWQSSKERGVCSPSLWNEWMNDINEKERRGLSVWRA